MSDVVDWTQKNHNWAFLKLNVTEVWLIDFFGGAALLHRTDLENVDICVPSLELSVNLPRGFPMSLMMVFVATIVSLLVFASLNRRRLAKPVTSTRDVEYGTA